MTSAQRELFADSLQRCLAHSQFIDRFYERFLASSPEIREKFKHTDMKRQRRVLRKSLYALIFASQGTDTGRAELDRVARSHSKAEYDIPPRLYGFWLDSLVEAARESDPGFGPETEKAWRLEMKGIIDYITAHHGSDPPNAGG